MPTDDPIDVTGSEAAAADPVAAAEEAAHEAQMVADEAFDAARRAREEAAIERHDPEAAPAFIDPDALGRPPVSAVGSALPGLSVIPPETEMRSLAQLANTLAHADACPKPMRRKPNDVFLVLLTARDLGTAITTALREFHVIEGRVTLSPKVKLAMVRSRPDLGRVRPAPTNDALSATWFSVRADGGGAEVASTFSWDDAQLAGLVDSRCTPYEHWKGDGRGSGRSSADCLCKDNWKRYPKRMLSWRALGYLLDDEYPEIGTGLYSPDELGAVTDADGEPIEVSAVESLPGMRGGQSAGGGQAQGDEPADPAKVAELKARLAVVKGNDAAHEELKTWWVGQELPPVDQLPARKVALVEARLAHVERQHGIERPPAGEEAPAAADGETGPEDGQDGHESGGGGQEPPEPPADAPGGAEAAPEATEESEPTDREALEASIVEGQPHRVTDDPDTWIPTSPPDGDVAAWLIMRANALSAPSVKTAYTVAGLEPPKGNVQALRKAWALWQFDLIAHAVTAWLGLAFGVATAPATES